MWRSANCATSGLTCRFVGVEQDALTPLAFAVLDPPEDPPLHSGASRRSRTSSCAPARWTARWCARCRSCGSPAARWPSTPAGRPCRACWPARGRQPAHDPRSRLPPQLLVLTRRGRGGDRRGGGVAPRWPWATARSVRWPSAPTIPTRRRRRCWSAASSWRSSSSAATGCSSPTGAGGGRWRRPRSMCSAAWAPAMPSGAPSVTGCCRDGRAERVVAFANAAGAIVASRLLCSQAMPFEHEVRALAGEGSPA